ncbi:MAG: hypothetical protein IPK44_07345 [Candidatus Accumulibacter sp.]|uniref:hypothetical protein n=1 Tax=Accumulibacter sp. TaxID=2053492 RepID=UPI00258ABF13|nr:hypothetical protein [Accumulibacter sp.]MBK8114350.1 hypothetical protein [Accumulibacter sp.]
MPPDADAARPECATHPAHDLAEAQHDLATCDLRHPRFSRLQQLPRKAEDTEMALGSDILIAALEGYALAKAIRVSDTMRSRKPWPPVSAAAAGQPGLLPNEPSAPRHRGASPDPAGSRARPHSATARARYSE